VRLPGTCATVAGTAFPDEISQQGRPSVLARKLIPEEQWGPQHSCVFAVVPSRQAPNADKPLARMTNANITATNLSL